MKRVWNACGTRVERVCEHVLTRWGFAKARRYGAQRIMLALGLAARRVAHKSLTGFKSRAIHSLQGSV